MEGAAAGLASVMPRQVGPAPGLCKPTARVHNPPMKDRIWIVLVLALLLGIVAGWWGKGRWAEHQCTAQGGVWHDTASACGKVRA